MHIYTPSQDTFHATVDMPDDLVEDRDASNQNVPDEGVWDNAAYLKKRLSTSRFLVDAFDSYDASSPGSVLSSNALGTLNNGVLILGSNVALAIGDIVHVSVSFHGETSAAALAWYALQAKDYGLSRTPMPGAELRRQTAGTEIFPYALNGTWTVTAAGIWTCYLCCACVGATGPTVNVEAQMSMHGTAWRAV